MNKNSRGACPILNAFANSGIINSTGRNLNSETIKQLSKFTNISIYMFYIVLLYIKIMKLFSFSIWDFSLDDISDHHIIEHDNSIARYDFNEENKNTYKTKINIDNLNEYTSLCKENGYIYKNDVLDLKNKKYTQKQNKSYFFDKLFPNIEINAVFKVFGKDDRISQKDFIEIFYDEKIPQHFLDNHK